MSKIIASIRLPTIIVNDPDAPEEQMNDWELERLDLELQYRYEWGEFDFEDDLEVDD